jgi:hypothetical protein
MLLRLVARCALLVALVGCGAPSRPDPIATQFTCGDVVAGACNEQALLLVTAAGGAVRAVRLDCLAGPCDRTGGAGEATVTLADGTTVRRSFTYAGDPNPPPNPVCLGVARDICLERVKDVIGDVSPSHRLTGVTVTCKQVCDARSGDVTIAFTSDGAVDLPIETTWGGS